MLKTKVEAKVFSALRNTLPMLIYDKIVVVSIKVLCNPWSYYYCYMTLSTDFKKLSQMINELRYEKTCFYAYAKTKAQIGCTVLPKSEISSL